MGFGADSRGPEHERDAAEIDAYVKREKKARGEGPQEQSFPACPNCGQSHSPHYDCQK
jgi:hypothetical protein